MTMHPSHQVLFEGSLGALPMEGGVAVRVWAPDAQQVHAVSPSSPDLLLDRRANGWHEGFAIGWTTGTCYGFRLDDDPTVYADPASRYQPDGPHGLSAVVDPNAFVWSDEAWEGLLPDGNVVYEMHVGTFTSEGTFPAAMERLPYLADLGVTAIELMPLNEFSGRFGWGYDGVNLFAPTRLYGAPDDLKRFVDRAHALGLGVVLDVVYNHLGPSGNHLERFAKAYFTDRYSNDWGKALNFDGPDAAPVRDFFLANVEQWIGEYHMDGLRVDATQDIHDSGAPHILGEIVRTARLAAGARRILLIAENEPQDRRLLDDPARGGFGFDALWNDDFHHTASVALTSRAEAYYSDHRGHAQEFVSLAKRGFLFQGQRYAWQKKPRGTPTRGLKRSAFVNYLQNHDQIANQVRPRRVHTLAAPGRVRALTAFALLSPGTPMLFQGQEFHASALFAYFADHDGELGASVREGRLAFMAQFASLSDETARAAVPDPTAASTFEACKLDWREAESSAALALHKDLLTIRRCDATIARGDIDGAVVTHATFVIRYFSEDGEDRLLLVNLGGDHITPSLAEPLIAPPIGRRWSPVWSSEHAQYGGTGLAPVITDDGWRIPGAAAVLLGTVVHGSGR